MTPADKRRARLSHHPDRQTTCVHAGIVSTTRLLHVVVPFTAAVACPLFSGVRSSLCMPLLVAAEETQQ